MVIDTDISETESNWKFANVFWDAGCTDTGNRREKRLADINTDTQIGGGKFTENDPTYTLINIHGPTAIWACVIFGLLFLLAIGLRIMYIKRHKKMKRQVNRHRAIVMASSYHRADCTKIDPERDCNCKAEQGQPGYRCPTHFDADDAVPCGQPLWLGP